MNAHKFVAEKGIEEAKRVLENSNDAWAYDSDEDYFFDGSDIQDGYSIEHSVDCFLVEELKQVVESLELIINDFEIVEIAEYEYMICGSQNELYWVRLKKAIADYELVESYKQEKCEVLDMVDVSPRCEVRNG